MRHAILRSKPNRKQNMVLSLLKFDHGAMNHLWKTRVSLACLTYSLWLPIGFLALRPEVHRFMNTKDPHGGPAWIKAPARSRRHNWIALRNPCLSRLALTGVGWNAGDGRWSKSTYNKYYVYYYWYIVHFVVVTPNHPYQANSKFVSRSTFHKYLRWGHGSPCQKVSLDI